MKRIFTVEIDAPNDEYDLVSALSGLAEEVVAVNIDNEYAIVVSEGTDVIFTSQG